MATPVTVAGITGATQVAGGEDFTCAVLIDTTAKCWGDDAFGQLGSGSIAPTSTPVTVSGLTDVSNIAAGRWHACAVQTTGTMKCWGANS